MRIQRPYERNIGKFIQPQISTKLSQRKPSAWGYIYKVGRGENVEALFYIDAHENGEIRFSIINDGDQFFDMDYEIYDPNPEEYHNVIMNVFSLPAEKTLKDAFYKL